MNPAPRDLLLHLLAEKSFRLGDFKLSSGASSDYYIDCRTTTLHAEGARLIARVVTDVISQNKWKPKAIGGMTLGADPMVAAVAMLSAQQIMVRAPARTKPIDAEEFYLHGFIVRKGEKEHGTGQRIEGYQKKGSKVVIVDDVCTTGKSTIDAIAAAREFGFEVAGVLCLVEREEAGGRANVEKAAAPAPFVAVFTAKQIREEHAKMQKPASAS